MSEEVIINKVAESGLVTINLEDYLPLEEIVGFDIKDYLFMGLILKEKEFRQSLKEMDKEVYRNKIAAVYCSADAIIPMWAYMLISSTLKPFAKEVLMGDEKEAEKKQLIKNIHNIHTTEYSGKRLVIKGCGEKQIPEEAYLEITNILQPVAKSIMFGEPCSTVPIYKQQAS